MIKLEITEKKIHTDELNFDIKFGVPHFLPFEFENLSLDDLEKIENELVDITYQLSNFRRRYSQD
jgi:hypothetical protein